MRSTSSAPKVIAKGTGLLARRIVKTAQAHGVPVLERKPLARALYRAVDVGREIPSALYHAVAEILVYVYRLRQPKPTEHYSPLIVADKNSQISANQ